MVQKPWLGLYKALKASFVTVHDFILQSIMPQTWIVIVHCLYTDHIDRAQLQCIPPLNSKHMKAHINSVNPYQREICLELQIIQKSAREWSCSQIYLSVWASVFPNLSSLSLFHITFHIVSADWIIGCANNGETNVVFLTTKKKLQTITH